MIERVDTFRTDEFDEEDVVAQQEINYPQTIAETHLAATGLSVNDMDEDSQQTLTDTVDPYLAFELQQSDSLYKGMPLVLSGQGGFLITDYAGSLLGAQETATGDVITGNVTEVKAYPVPSRSLMTEPRHSGEAIPTHDQSLSVVLVLNNVKFYANPTDDGIFQVVHDLSDLRVAVPVIYGMETRVADIDA
jgi:hypothetical protein